MKRIKKFSMFILAMAIMASGIYGCAKSDDTITVVSREPGSGTRGAFIELFGIEEKDSAGNKTDKTTKESLIMNKTDVMITQVASNSKAIGYISLGSLNDTVKALKIDGVEASAENVKNNSYKISRPFNIATKGDGNNAANDFITFILSKQGQEIVGKDYVAVSDSAPEFTSTKPTGKIVVEGSSSVYPVMEKLKEAYTKINPALTIEVQQDDSTTGVKAAIAGTCDIAMVSRELKESEKELTEKTIALDGIAVIVNNENSLNEITSDTVKKIYTDEIKSWSEIK